MDGARPVSGAPHTFSVSSLLTAAPEKVWARVSTLSGVNAEMAPWFRMTGPRGLDRFEPQQLVLGQRLFRSWLLLFGVLPVDYDDLTFVRFEPGQGFLERSRMISAKVWEHERTLEPHPEGTLLTDRLRFEPRLPLPGLRALYSGVFRHRHERLRRHFGGRSAS
jgi:ligand-binding SRPBCC domain-containing protein